MFSFHKTPTLHVSAIVVVMAVLGQSNPALAGKGPATRMAQAKPVLKLAAPKTAIFRPGDLVAVNTVKDKCYNVGADGKRVEVPCPDVIVAKPSPSSSSSAPSGRQVAKMFKAGKLAKRPVAASFGARVETSGGTYNCYKEDPPGHFTPVTCPDIIVLDTTN